ncbi:MAG: DUF1844 domain-containing protein [Pseudomonadota bacterium]|nr:DUF1844 domain-containing protein [Pseudomonadota bacterium]
MAEEKQEKGFVIKDRRLFDESGEIRREKDEGTSSVEEEKPPLADAAPDREEQEEEEHFLPEVNFINFVLSLSTTAMFHFGDFTDPAAGKAKKNMAAAKHTIDTITMLADKTKGNLDDNEKNVLDAVLFELRMRYVKECGPSSS